MVVYTNPANNVQVNVVFEKMNYPLSIELTDMSGRLVRIWVNYNENRLTIAKVPQGIGVNNRDGQPMVK